MRRKEREFEQTCLPVKICIVEAKVLGNIKNSRTSGVKNGEEISKILWITRCGNPRYFFLDNSKTI